MKRFYHIKIKNIIEIGFTRMSVLVSLFLLLSVKGFAQPLTVIPTATPNPLCVGASVQLDAGASGGSSLYTYTWSTLPSSGFTSSVFNPTDNPVATTTYNVDVFDGTNTVSGQVTVIVNNAASIGSVTGTTPLCIGASATYTANAVVLSEAQEHGAVATQGLQQLIHQD